MRKLIFLETEKPKQKKLRNKKCFSIEFWHSVYHFYPFCEFLKSEQHRELQKNGYFFRYHLS